MTRSGSSSRTRPSTLSNKVARAAERSPDEAGFFTRLRYAGVLVRLRFSEIHPGQVTGYSVALRGQDGSDGAPVWYGGGRPAAGLTLPRLRSGWDPARSARPDQPGVPGFTDPERDAIFEHAARQAAAAAEHIRCSARNGPAGACDAAWAAADTLHVVARALHSPQLCRAADAYDRAARAQHGRIPRATPQGSQLRAAARLMALAGPASGDATLATIALIANLMALAIAVAELRQAQQLTAQAAAARTAATQLQAARVQARSPVPHPGRGDAPRPGQRVTAAGLARTDVAMPVRPWSSPPVGPGLPGGWRRRPLPPQ